MYKFKSIVTQDSNQYNCGDINLIVGGNNTGKSTFLKELVECAVNPTAEGHKNVKTIEIELSKCQKEFKQLFPKVDLHDHDTVNKSINFGLYSGLGLNGCRWDHNIHNYFVELKNKKKCIQLNSYSNHDAILQFFSFWARLRSQAEMCEGRLQGPFKTNIPNIGDEYSDIIKFLFAEGQTFKQIQSHIKKVFGIKIIFDDLIHGDRPLRIAPKRKPSRSEKSSFAELNKYWHRESPLIEQQGDGLKAYLRIMYSIYNPFKEVFFFDEPEAFIHPPQRRSLGEFIAQGTKQGKQFFIATHDPEIMRGVIASTSTPRIDIFYLQRNKSNFSISHIKDFTGSSKPSTEYNEANLNSFFYNRTILCESEDDRLVYQFEAQKHFPDLSYNLNFIGYSGKSEVLKNYKIHKSWGLNPVAILDADALYSKELSVLKFSPSLYTKIKSIRNNAWFSTNGNKDLFKENGINTLTIPEDLKLEIQEVIKELKKTGIYVLSFGQLESCSEGKINKGMRNRGQLFIDLINKKKLSILMSFMKAVLK